MTTHLSPEQFADALGAESQALDPRAAAHLQDCAACREHLASARAVLDEVRSVEAPEPSPLFWDHFSARVREATVSERAGATRWWVAYWRPAVATAFGVVALALALRPGPEVTPGSSELAQTSPLVETGALSDDGTWRLVVGLASELDWQDVEQVATPLDGTADAMIAELTAAQREALARLLQQEMGDL